jgi:hypothetical protein
MAKTLINIWLTILGPGALILGILGAAYVLTQAPYLTFEDFAVMIGLMIVYGLSAWGFFNRIWDRG